MNDRTVKPYFVQDEPSVPISEEGPNVMFVDFLARLDGAARVDIDLRQELLVMQLRARCIRYALAPESDGIIIALNQLCALYHVAAVRIGRKAFDVFEAFLGEYVKVQEQVFLSRDQTAVKDQRPTALTNNLLNYCHELLESFLRKLATLGTFSLDVLSGDSSASGLSAQQYVDLSLKGKVSKFENDPKIVRRTFELLFGSVQNSLRNSIAHRRYVIEEDGTAVLHDFHPKKRTRTLVGKVSQSEIRALLQQLEMAVDTFEISLLIFQHNHGSIMLELGFHQGDEELSEAKIAERLYMEAPAAFLRIDSVAFEGGTLKIDVKLNFPAFARQTKPSTVYVQSKNRLGEQVKYALTVPSRDLSARDQTLRFRQKASLYCQKHTQISIRTFDEKGKPVGEVSSTLEWIRRALADRSSIDQFLGGVIKNTFQTGAGSEDIVV